VSGFVDECNLHVRAGDGGAGCVSTRREAHVPLGGPDGGDGGHGGDVWLVADRNVASLLAFRDHPHREADRGVHGKGGGRHGRRGRDLDVPVPVGTIVHDFDGTVLADLTNEGDRWLAAAGGRGGRGNARFLSNKRRAPSFAEQGEHGEERWIRLELKLMADVALVGYPNVGKSTLISRISAAKPKIADYPFTTLEPNLGVVRVDEGRDEIEMVVADIPGLIEGASEGKGLGHQFLRHIERARALVVLLDLAGGAGATPAEQLRVLLHELGEYRPELLTRPRLVVGSRADVAVDHLDQLDPADRRGNLAELEAREPLDSPESLESLDGSPEADLEISAVTGVGLPVLVGRMADAVRAARAAVPAPDTFIVHRPVAQGYRIEREDDGSFRVVGREAERAVALSDLTNVDALDEAHRRLQRLGIDKALARAGADEGDIVRIGTLTFAYER
jgi:GTP-binding protein